jgi:hypothetical protein
MATDPQKAAVELAVFANEHGFDRRLHVVVDAARAGPLEESKGAIVRADPHLLGLAPTGPHAPLSFAPGEAYQFDWSHEIVLINGVTVTVEVVDVRLCHSRMLFVLATFWPGVSIVSDLL